jgi:hypothetical protein
MFLGLRTEAGAEPDRNSGYHRIDLSRFSFGISPKRGDHEAFTFVNLVPIKGPLATRDWGRLVEGVIFAEVDDTHAGFFFPLTGAARVSAGSSISFAPGRLQFGVFKNVSIESVR